MSMSLCVFLGMFIWKMPEGIDFGANNLMGLFSFYIVILVIENLELK